MVLKSLGRLIRRGIGQAAANDFARPEWGTAQETQARVDSLLCSQDHLNRIRLIPSSIRGDESIMNLHAEESLPKPKTLEVHCIPFWVVRSMGRFDTVYLEKQSGQTIQTQMAASSDFDYTVSAVPSDHWCSGLVLRDDIGQTSDWLHEKGIRPSPLFQRDLHPLQRLIPGRYEMMRPPTITNAHIMDPNLMEPFAKTYPIVKGDLLARLIERSDAAFTKDKSFHIILRCVEEMQTRAFPTYRLVYKATFDSTSRIGFWDSTFDHTQKKYGQRQFLLPSVGPTTNVAEKSHFSRFSPSHANDPAGMGGSIAERWAFAPRPTLNMEYANLILNSMEERELDWYDPNILAADIGPLGDLQSLINCSDARVTNPKQGPPPTAFAPPPSAPETSSRRRVNTIPPPRRPPPAPRPAAPQKPKEQPIDRPPPPSNAKASPRGPGLNLPLRPPVLRPSPSPPAPVIMRDAKGFYAILGIQPDATFIDESFAEETLRALSDKRVDLQKNYHPDKVGPAAAERSGAVNNAFDQLKTVEKRRRYQDKLQTR